MGDNHLFEGRGLLGPTFNDPGVGITQSTEGDRKKIFWATWYNFLDPVDKYLRESKSCTKYLKNI